MNYRYLKINPKLEEYVRTVLVFEPCSDIQTSCLPLFTNGIPALFCRTRDDSIQITLFGQSVPNEKWAIEDSTKLIAFFFKPFALGTVFKLSAQELKEKPIELNLWNAQKAIALNMQLFDSDSTKEKIEVLDHFILSQIQANQRECEIILYATDKILRNPTADILSKILQELNLTERTFQRIFKRYVGITANEYRRICQFHIAFSQLKNGHFDKLTELAYVNGYFDQSHYIRSFKEFTDTTPNEYLQFGLKKK